MATPLNLSSDLNLNRQRLIKAVRQDHIKQFLKEVHQWRKLPKWLRWLHDFKEDSGLCFNIRRWLSAKRLDCHEIHCIIKELEGMFLADKLDQAYPFNDDDTDYERECAYKTIFNNADRLAWIALHRKM